MTKLLVALIFGFATGSLIAELLRPTESQPQPVALSEQTTAQVDGDQLEPLSARSPESPISNSREADSKSDPAAQHDSSPVAGQVIDSNGKPLPGVLIRLAIQPSLEMKSAGDQARKAAVQILRQTPSTSTDALGRYQFGSFDEQSLTLRATLKGYEILPRSDATGERNRQDFIAHRAHTVRVRFSGIDESQLRRALLSWRLIENGPLAEAMRRKPSPPVVQDWTPTAPQVALRAGQHNINAALLDESSRAFAKGYASITITGQEVEQAVEIRLQETRRLWGHLALPTLQKHFSVSLLMTLYRGDLSLASASRAEAVAFHAFEGYHDQRKDFAFTNLERDVYTLDLSLGKDNHRTTLRRVPVDLRPGSRQVIVSVDRPPSQLEVQCQDPDGNPLEGAQLMLSRGDGIREAPYLLVSFDGSLQSTQILSYWPSPEGESEAYREIGLRGNHPEYGFVDVEIPVPPSGSMVLRWPEKQSLRVHVPGIHQFADRGTVEITLASKTDSNFVRLVNSQFDAEDQATVKAPFASAFRVGFSVRHREPRLNIDFAPTDVALDSEADLLRLVIPPHGTLLITSPPAQATRVFHIRQIRLPTREGEELAPAVESSFEVAPSATPTTITIGPIPIGSYSLTATLENSAHSDGSLEVTIQGTEQITWEPRLPGALVVALYDPEGLYAIAGVKDFDHLVALDGVRIGKALTAEAALARLSNPIRLKQIQVRRGGVTLAIPIDGDAIAKDPDLGGADFQILSEP